MTVLWVALTATVVFSLLLTDDVRSVPMFLANMAALALVTAVVGRHDWARAIQDGQAPARAELWALAVLAIITVNIGLVIPRPGSWWYYLVLAAYFAVLLPAVRAARVTVLAIGGALLVESVAGAVAPVLVTAAVVIVVVALVTQGIGGIVGRVVADARHRAGLITTVARSAERVSSLDPVVVQRQVADAAMQLGFDLVAVTERVHEQHRMVVERSRVGTVFEDATMPWGPLVREAVEGRELVARHHYLSGRDPHPGLQARGIDAVVVSPVIVDREVVALFVGGLQEPEIEQSLLEAFSLLGSLLSQALGNARRFERERAAVATLDELGRLKDDFLSNVSHELRTPITVIVGGLYTLQEHGDRIDPATRDSLMRRAVANAESLQSTLGALLEFARIERGGVDPSLAVVDLALLARESVDRLGSVLAEHEVRLDLDAGPAPVRAAPGQLDRVVDNLLVNVARHTPPGTTVGVGLEVGATHVTLVVEDDGPGIAPADVPRLTDRFFRGGASTTRESRGLGLGLALAQRILEAHDSRLQVWSEPGVGARFTFTLPLTDGRG